MRPSRRIAVQIEWTKPWRRVSLLSAALLLLHCTPGGAPAPEQIGEAARDALEVGDPFLRSARWSDVLITADPAAQPVLEQALGDARIDTGDPEVVSFAMWWARFDPEAALSWTESEWMAGSWLVVAAVVRTWAHADPQQAFERALAVVPESHRNAAINAAIAGWEESGKPGLVEYIEAIASGVQRQQLAEPLARRIVLARGAEQAARWVEAIESPPFREIMARRVASSAAEQGEAEVIAAWAAPRITSGDELPSGFPRRIGTRWVVRDPTAAMAWLESLPAGRDRDDGVMESFRDWHRYTPGAAATWIHEQEAEPWLEPALAMYATSIAAQNPEESLAIISRFSDEALRNRMTTVIARSWASRDPQAAAEWLAEADVPEDVRKRASLRIRSPEAMQPIAP